MAKNWLRKIVKVWAELLMSESSDNVDMPIISGARTKGTERKAEVERTGLRGAISKATTDGKTKVSADKEAVITDDTMMSP